VWEVSNGTGNLDEDGMDGRWNGTGSGVCEAEMGIMMTIFIVMMMIMMIMIITMITMITAGTEQNRTSIRESPTTLAGDVRWGGWEGMRM
jgi:hypothetical protein